jgi:hypothetical protein
MAKKKRERRRLQFVGDRAVQTFWTLLSSQQRQLTVTRQLDPKNVVELAVKMSREADAAHWTARTEQNENPSIWPLLQQALLGHQLFLRDQARDLTAARDREWLTGVEEAGRQRPHWDSSNGTLKIDGKLAKMIQNISQATNVILLLDTFELENWSPRIDNPLPAGKRDATIRSLNDGLLFMRFHGDGTTKGIRWLRADM